MALGPTYFDGSTFFNDSDKDMEDQTTKIEGSLNGTNYIDLSVLGADLSPATGTFVRAANTTYSPKYLRATIKLAGKNAVTLPALPMTAQGTFYYAAYLRAERRVDGAGNVTYWAVFVGSTYNTLNNGYSVRVVEVNVP